MITISNGPYTGAALKLAPDAKLNDHMLTITIFTMPKFALVASIFRLKRNETNFPSSTKTYQATEVSIHTEYPQRVHADALTFGKTPVTCKVFPSALTVVTGFPVPDEDPALESRTLLDP